MTVELGDLRCFVTVGELLHFGKAASRLGYTPSNVSYRIRSLERELGTELFQRTSRRVTLTPNGTDLLVHARDIVEAVDSLHRRAAELVSVSRRSLSIAYSPYTNDVVINLVREIRVRMPDTQVSATLRNSNELVESVLDRTSDVAVTIWPPPQLKAIQIGPAPVISLLLPTGHRLEKRSSVTIDDLEGEALLIISREQNAELHDLTVRFYASHSIRPDFRPRYITSTDQALDFVATGQGICHVFDLDRPPPGTTAVPVKGTPLPLDGRYLVWNEANPPPLLRQLIRIAQVVSGPTASGVK